MVSEEHCACDGGGSMTITAAAWRASATAQPLPWRQLSDAGEDTQLSSFHLQQIEELMGGQDVCWLGPSGRRRDVGLWWRWAPVWFVAGTEACLWIALRRRSSIAPQPWHVLVPRAELAVAYNPATGALHARHPDYDDLPLVSISDHLAYRICETLTHNIVTES